MSSENKPVKGMGDEDLVRAIRDGLESIGLVSVDLTDPRLQHLRDLPRGGEVRVLKTGRMQHLARYNGQIGRKVCAPTDAMCWMLVRFEDGQEYYVPMTWLELVDRS